MASLNTASRPWNKPKTVAPAPKSAPPRVETPDKKLIGTLNVATGEYTQITANHPIDRLAAIRVQIAKLTKEEKELTAEVRAMGDGEHDGNQARAEVSTTTPDKGRLDVDAIREAMPEDWVARFTVRKPQTTVRIKPLV
jgi:hypothetical protein